jgi:hypothetical protein
MPNCNRREAEARVAADEGPPEDTVYPSDTRSNSSRPSYHDDPDCQYRDGDPDPLTRETAQAKWFVPCKGCVEGVG